MKHRSLGILILVGLAWVATCAIAQEGETAEKIIRGDLQAQTKAFLALAAGIGMALATLGGALGQGRAISAALEGIARNPGASKDIFNPMIIGLALIESLVILTFVITLGLSGKI